VRRGVNAVKTQKFEKGGPSFYGGAASAYGVLQFIIIVIYKRYICIAVL